MVKFHCGILELSTRKQFDVEFIQNIITLTNFQLLYLINLLSVKYIPTNDPAIQRWCCVSKPIYLYWHSSNHANKKSTILCHRLMSVGDFVINSTTQNLIDYMRGKTVKNKIFSRLCYTIIYTLYRWIFFFLSSMRIYVSFKMAGILNLINLWDKWNRIEIVS